MSLLSSLKFLWYRQAWNEYLAPFQNQVEGCQLTSELVFGGVRLSLTGIDPQLWTPLHTDFAEARLLYTDSWKWRPPVLSAVVQHVNPHLDSFLGNPTPQRLMDVARAVQTDRLDHFIVELLSAEKDDWGLVRLLQRLGGFEAIRTMLMEAAQTSKRGAFLPLDLFEDEEMIFELIEDRAIKLDVRSTLAEKLSEKPHSHKRLRELWLRQPNFITAKLLGEIRRDRNDENRAALLACISAGVDTCASNSKDRSPWNVLKALEDYWADDVEQLVVRTVLRKSSCKPIALDLLAEHGCMPETVKILEDLYQSSPEPEPFDENAHDPYHYHMSTWFRPAAKKALDAVRSRSQRPPAGKS